MSDIGKLKQFLLDNYEKLEPKQKEFVLRLGDHHPTLEDLSRYENVDIEAELTRLWSQRIAEEIDREILERLMGL